MSLLPILALSIQLVGAAAASPPSAATAQVGPAPSSPSVAAATPAPDPMMCQRVGDTGDAFPKKQCHRVSVWARMARGQ